MNPLQRAAIVRKTTYLGAILVLFTLSMIWRGAIPVPLSGSSGPFRWAAGHTIQAQARNLDVWELDPQEGEAEITGSALRLTLTGSRGLAVSALWLSAIDKQKRNDFHEFEQRVMMVTKLQPNFITPWIFQSWNIAYNVSVEMHGSGDMYFYIVRGIQLLAEGERHNKRSPDIRYQIAFYYQNKFGVSDQVETLRCLFDLSCIPPSQRNPKQFEDPETGRINYAKFQEFCEKHPHLVRRLRGEDLRYTDKRAKEKLRRGTPKEVVDFLKTNWEVPSRYRPNYLKELTDDLAETENQFPALPPQFNEGPDEANPTSGTADDRAPGLGYFTGFKAARAWFSYSLLLLPPPLKDAQGLPVPGPTPAPGTFDHDPAKHRVPRLPMMVIFRQGAPRAQSYQAEMEQKEGWFDEEGWQIDDPSDQPSKWWFPDNPDRPTQPRGVVVGTGRAWSLEEWRKAAEMWDRHGRDYGLVFAQGRRETLENRRGDPGSLPNDPTPEQLTDPVLRERYLAKVALEYYGSNRSVTNFPYFLASAQAEAKSLTVRARKTLWKAEQARKISNPPLAIRLYKEGLGLWKQVLTENKDFLRPERSDRTEEETAEYDLAYLRLLVQDDERVRKRANEQVHAAQAVVPFLTLPFQTEALAPGQVAVADPLWTTANREEIKWYVVENVADADFSSPFVGSLAPDRIAWVSETMKESVRSKQGVSRKPQQQAPAPGPGGPGGPPMGRPSPPGGPPPGQ
ncbi:hypothetical protein VT84_23210 [Gemmata sp. SH-PL17]|uniref:hypothetical protein n=1 Tax=Gemmata sp. SH-PL17 TaxID=1630693 RepID=UPI00078D7C34|nr:hypothetical protein [Gemmata sp. SH-PL17]AMV27328.1 hypothetical protein VT84_23210 [Gemmata sp. SH-PL17]